jgi:hypothetical protein
VLHKPSEHLAKPTRHQQQLVVRLPYLPAIEFHDAGDAIAGNGRDPSHPCTDFGKALKDESPGCSTTSGIHAALPTSTRRGSFVGGRAVRCSASANKTEVGQPSGVHDQGRQLPGPQLSRAGKERRQDVADRPERVQGPGDDRVTGGLQPDGKFAARAADNLLTAKAGHQEKLSNADSESSGKARKARTARAGSNQNSVGGEIVKAVFFRSLGNL